MKQQTSLIRAKTRHRSTCESNRLRIVVASVHAGVRYGKEVTAMFANTFVINNQGRNGRQGLRWIRRYFTKNSDMEGAFAAAAGGFERPSSSMMLRSMLSCW